MKTSREYAAMDDAQPPEEQLQTQMKQNIAHGSDNSRIKQLRNRILSLVGPYSYFSWWERILIGQLVAYASDTERFTVQCGSVFIRDTIERRWSKGIGRSEDEFSFEYQDDGKADWQKQQNPNLVLILLVKNPYIER